MIEIEHRIRIECDLETVWRILADIPSWPGWTPTVSGASVLPGDGLKRFVLKQSMQRAATWTVTDWRQGNGFIWERVDGRLCYRAEHSLLCEEKNVISIARLWVTGAGVVTRLLMAPIFKTVVAVENRALKQRCETAGTLGGGVQERPSEDKNDV
ncbi:hypothetical protein FLO80_18860 [Aquicoccus porphyridii]|uniref:Polyketide cyclase n=1 Tax=Aquicoccus porphyridii TaxID=1852029 RepID=A0A5A9YYV8_9RHOB|nr:SRPBCC family protein [Aquicoccus porphyridii]KAA0910038.1 hypothetical protein FLO80_18860 [Aquicoccus porphyridii]RAI52096.1 hypothetical protein DOO74_19500 [Rhodobacteraceae bacterium AsT-22]